MRAIKTFILRLLMNTEEAQVLRGTVRRVDNDEERTFTDGKSLLALLHQMGQTTPRQRDSGQ